MKIPVELIVPNPEQPREEFNQVELRSLAESIRENGLLNPISVEGPVDGQYILIDGERRWRAHKLLGLEEIEAHVRSADAQNGSHRLVLALVGNLMRADLNPLEEAKGFLKLRDAGLTLEEISQRVGRSVGSVSSRFMLLEMDAPIQLLVAGKRLPFDPPLFKALRDIPETGQRVKVAVMAAEKRLSATQVKHLIKRLNLPRLDRKQKPVVQANVVKGERLRLSGGHWNAIAQLGFRPGDARLAAAAEAVCQDCPLYEVADEKVCSECPMVDLLRRMG